MSPVVTTPQEVSRDFTTLDRVALCSIAHSIHSFTDSDQCQFLSDLWTGVPDYLQPESVTPLLCTLLRVVRVTDIGNYYVHRQVET